MNKLSRNQIDKFVSAEDGDFDLLKFNFASIKPEELPKMSSVTGHITADVPDLFEGAHYDSIHAYMMAHDGSWELCEAYIINLMGHEVMGRANFTKMIAAKTGLKAEVEDNTIHLFEGDLYG